MTRFRYDRLPLGAAVLATAAVLAVLGGLLAAPPPRPEIAPPPRPEIAPPPVPEIAPPPVPLGTDDGMPNPEYRLPPNELAPDEVVILLDAGDVADWSHGAVGIPDAHKVTEGEGEIVAVIDTGIDAQHRDLKDQIVEGKDFTGSASGWADVNGHGTHCAGVIAAARNGVGMVGGAPKSKILALKALGDRGSGLSTWIAGAVDYAVAWRGPKGERVGVISMSLGSAAADARIKAAVERAVAAGIIVVAAAGNDGPREGTVGYPGGFPDVICVAATTDQTLPANFSSRGKAVLIAAPGAAIRNCYPGDRFATMSGTSMATPLVAAHAALYRAWCRKKGSEPTPAEFRKLLEVTSKDLAPAGRDTSTGFGLIQPAKMLAPVPVPMPKDPPKDELDRVVIELPPELVGRKLRRIILDFEPVKP